MDTHLAADLARDLDKTCDALACGGALLQGLDRVLAALTLAERETYSPLRTVFEQALIETQRVRQILQNEGAAPSNRAVLT